MSDYIALPRRLSDVHLDENTSDIEVKPSGRVHRRRDQSNIITYEAPKGPRRERDQSNIITFTDPHGERSPSPSSRYPGGMDTKEFDRMEERRLDELERRDRTRAEFSELQSLRMQLRDRDEECLDLKFQVNQLERQVTHLRKQLEKCTAPPDFDERPTYIKVHRKHLAAETLEKFRLPWEFDPTDPDYVVIKQYVDERLQNELFEHTNELKERERALREREERVLILEERERRKNYVQPTVVVPGRRERYYEQEASQAIRRPRTSERIRPTENDALRRSRIEIRPPPESDGWRFTGAAETPRDDIERPRPRGGPR